MNTPTPRTDAIVHEKWIPPVIDCVPADFARQLERELAEALERINKRTERIHELEKVCHEWCMENAKLNQDRDEWKAIAEELAKNCRLALGYYGTTWKQAQEIDAALARFNAKKNNRP